ncbi:Putative LOC100162944, partial [Caligus rogercresseyi]
CHPTSSNTKSVTWTPDCHVRYHSSDQDSDQIKTYLWPALFEGKNGPCVQKG